MVMERWTVMIFVRWIPKSSRIVTATAMVRLIAMMLAHQMQEKSPTMIAMATKYLIATMNVRLTGQSDWPVFAAVERRMWIQILMGSWIVMMAVRRMQIRLTRASAVAGLLKATWRLTQIVMEFLIVRKNAGTTR
jgi:hypothetical protein